MITRMPGVERSGRGSRASDGPLVTRRVAIGGAIAVSMASGPAWAQDLLDPSSLSGARVAAPNDLPMRLRPTDRINPSYARGMASSVTSAILSLVRAYGGTADQIGKLDARDKELTPKLDDAVKNKQLQLDEYRQGLFCSGCGRTKSDILSKGEQFPHANQTIIKPTPEQIAAKERQLQEIIDRIANELKDVRDKRAKLDPDINAIKEQLFEGMGLWRTAVGFNARLLRQEDLDDEDGYVRDRAGISKQLTAIPKVAAVAPRAAAVQQGIDDLRGWISTLDDVERRRSVERARYGESLTRGETAARQEVASVQTEANAVASRITAFGYSGYLAILTTLMSPRFDPNSIGEVGGYMFRMGRYDRATAGQILPNVAEFVGKASNTFPVFPQGAAPPASQESRVAENNVSRLQARRAALEAQEQRAQAAAEAARRQADPAPADTPGRQ